MSLLVRRTIPMVVTFVAGLVLFIDYFFRVPYVPPIAEMLLNFAIVIAAFALGLGAANLVMIHGGHIRKRTPRQWYFSAWLFIVMIVFIVVGVTFSMNSPLYVWLFNNTLTAVSTTIYSLLAFFIASGAYRAFRFRTKEGAVLLISGIITMLGNIPLIVSIYPGTSQLSGWIMDVVTMAGLRAILIGASVGTVILGIRTFLGRERGYMGGGME
jgi:hypothetical protein